MVQVWNGWRPIVATALVFAASALPSLRAQEPSSRQQAMARLARQLQELEAQQPQPGDVGEPARVQELQQRVSRLEDEFVGLATGFDAHRIEAPDERKYDLQTELMRLIRPLVRALSSATEGPRQAQELAEHLEGLDRRIAEAEQVQRGIERARVDAAGAAVDPVVRERLRVAEANWRAFTAELRSDRVLTAGRKEALEATRAPVADTVQNAVAGFFERRGVSLLLAGLVSVCVLLGLRFVHRQAMRVAGQRRLRLPMRVFDVAFQVLVGIAAALSVLLVFYLRGDFELLALAIVFLLGLGWALSRTLPLFVEQLRLLLNAGAVREGERLVVDGLPYRVDALRLHSRLVNPDLQGGVLRMPLKDLVGRASRLWSPDEPWFPSRQGDWVRLADGAWGRVELQTPEQVVVVIEQTRRTFRTADFIALNPTNLSLGFQLMVPFGIDYALQKESTSDVPERMAQALRQRLPELEGGKHLVRVQVEFAQAGSSSLDYEARVTFGGEAGSQFGILRRAIARILVDVCTQNGWTIPFPQLTLHRAN